MITYQRPLELRNLLQSFHGELVPGVNIVVSDDGSQDNTAEVCRQAASDYNLPLHYVRHPENLGFESNFLSAVAAADGDFIWLMGDDDALQPGGISVVMTHLHDSQPPAGLTLGSIDYDADMARPRGLGRVPRAIHTHGAEESLLAFSDFVGFMSSLVIRRDYWQRAVEAIGRTQLIRNYPHIQIMIWVLDHCDPGWRGVSEICVRFRSDNDHQLALYGWIGRLKIDVEGYRAVRLLGFRSLYSGWEFERNIIRSHIAFRLLNARLAGEPVRKAVRGAPYLAGYYRRTPEFWTLLIPLLILPSGALRFGRRIYRAVPSLSGSARATR